MVKKVGTNSDKVDPISVYFIEECSATCPARVDVTAWSHAE